MLTSNQLFRGQESVVYGSIAGYPSVCNGQYPYQTGVDGQTAYCATKHNGWGPSGNGLETSQAVPNQYANFYGWHSLLAVAIWWAVCKPDQTQVSSGAAAGAGTIAITQ
jgi:hypothetical protein